MDIGSITIICITVLVIAAIAGKCYMEHIALETKKNLLQSKFVAEKH